jgi:hypothetical protein
MERYINIIYTYRRNRFLVIRLSTRKKNYFVTPEVGGIVEVTTKRIFLIHI